MFQTHCFVCFPCKGPHVLDQTFSPLCQGLRKLFFLALAWPKECSQSNSKLLRNETLGGMTPEDWNKAGAPCAQHAHMRHWGLAITDKIYTRTSLQLRDAIAGLPEKTTGATRKLEPPRRHRVTTTCCESARRGTFSW